ncbi:class I SAM-dependent methyltransferase [bacterium]|nr:class I SAM-dependent methyltransferase [bacterium]
MDPDLDQIREIALRDEQAVSYEDSFKRTRGSVGYKAQIAAIISFLSPRKSEAIIDAGCGTGIYTLALAQHVKKLISVDFSGRSIDILNQELTKKQITNVATIVSDLSSVEFGNELFDKAISIEVLQHIPSREKKIQVLKNICKALKPGGQLVICVYRYGGWISPPQPQEEFNHKGTGLYRFAFTETDCRELLEESGYQIVKKRGLFNLPKRIRKRLPDQLWWLEFLSTKFLWSAKTGAYLLIAAKKIK